MSRTLTGRDPHEVHRVATPLELLFDLCSVVAVARIAESFHHAAVEGHVADGLQGFAMLFFAIWWAWMTFTWFASAYDTDDVAWRLLTFVQIAGALVIAGGVSSAFEQGDYRLVTIGYAIMRVSLVVRWLQVAVAHVEGRTTALRYAIGITVVQTAWLVRLALPDDWGTPSFVLLALAELAAVAWAEAARSTPWHPHHIAERYGLFTLIVIGETVLGATIAVEQAYNDGGVSASLIALSAGALATVFAIWWWAFRHEAGDHFARSSVSTFVWGYSHYFTFGAITLFGASVAAAVDVATHHAEHLSALHVGLLTSISVAVFLLFHGLLGRRYLHGRSLLVPLVTGAACVGLVALLAEHSLPLALVALPLPIVVALIATRTR